MSKKTGLGKGLGALIRDTGVDEGDQIKFIDIKSVVPRDDQPRRLFDEDALNELSESIREHGVLQPLIVQKKAINTK